MLVNKLSKDQVDSVGISGPNVPEGTVKAENRNAVNLTSYQTIPLMFMEAGQSIFIPANQI